MDSSKKKKRARERRSRGGKKGDLIKRGKVTVGGGADAARERRRVNGEIMRINGEIIWREERRGESRGSDIMREKREDSTKADEGEKENEYKSTIRRAG